MSEEIGEQIEALKQSIAALETQRNTISDTVLRAALVPLEKKLVELETQRQAQQHVGEQAVEQQRKMVTLLFMDIVGSTAIIQHMDPEDVSIIFDANLKRLADPVKDHGGHVTSYTGDGFLAVFGAPTAREDDPERAVRAGLAILERTEEISAELHKEWNIPGLKVRVGINTGLVILGGETEGEDTIKGPAVHLVARLQSAAPPGGILISHDTYRHIRGMFDVELLEPFKVKGFDEPIRAYRVLGVNARSFNQPLRGVEGLETRMIGREGELKCLQEALENSLESGEGQIITVIGEAGVGKSRLLEEFQNWLELRPERMWLFHGRGHSGEQGQPYMLLRKVFADRFEILEDDSSQTMRDKFVQGFLQGWNEGAEMKADILGQMLGYDFKDSPFLNGVLGDGEQLRNRGMMYLGEYWMEMSRKKPVVLLLEDIHWADDSTLDAVNWLEKRMAKLRMLVVCSTRGDLFERRPYWGEGEESHTQLKLKPLTKRESRELVEQILYQVTQLPESLRDLVVENAEGNPFYLEELIKMLIEDGVIVKGETEWRVEQDKLQITVVPSTLTGVLQARLDSLPSEERVVLQEASVVGRQFWDRLVAYLDTGGKLEAYPGLLQERLTSLRGRELIFRRETSAFAEAREYLFKHDLLREVTYESVLKKVRRAHHSLVADWLIANAGGSITEYAGLIGEHLALGGRGREAVAYLFQAGESALDAYSSHEAEGFFRHAMDFNPDEAQRLDVMHGLGKSLYNLGKRDEAVQALQMGIKLARSMGDQDGLAQLVYQLSQVLYRWKYMDASESWPICLQTVKELEAAPESPGLARLLSETARVAIFTFQSREFTITYCQRSIEMAERLGMLDVKLHASITLGLANTNPYESADIFEQAASQAEANGLLEIAIRAYSNLAVCEWKNFEFISMREHHRKAMQLSRMAGSVEDVISLLPQLVGDYIETGEMQAIPELVAQSLEGMIIPEQRASECQLDITYLLQLYKGQWMQALELSHIRLAEARQRNDLAAIMAQNSSINNACIDLFNLVGKGDLIEAEAALRENMEIIEENPHIGERIFALFALAQVDALLGRLEQAHLLLADGNQLVNQNDGIHTYARDTTRFYIDRAENRWDEALTIVESFLERIRESGGRWYLARFRINLGDTLVGRNHPGDRERARQAYQEALDLFTQIDAPGYIQILEERLTTMATKNL